MTGTIKRRL